MDKKRLPIGISDFNKLITEDCYFIDKSMLIKEVVEGSDIILFPRPRRFGKTLNLSMLRYFYDNSKDYRDIFNGLKIEKEDKIMSKQGKHPIIYLTFKDIKEKGYEKCMTKVKTLLAKMYTDHRYLLDSDILAEEEKEKFLKIVKETASIADYENTLKNLCEYLSKYYGTNPVILIDEYDMPIQAAYAFGYYDDFIGFMRNLLSGGLKDNSYLEKAVLTGILRVAKESIFSGLNNLKVISIINNNCGDKFGFSEEEVIKIVEDYNLEEKIEEVRKWYNGYNFGGINIYNPWSILNFIDDKDFRPYWVNTSGNDMIKDLLGKGDDKVKEDLEKLINGESIRKIVDDNIVYSEIDKQEESLWSFLLMSGYLRYDNFMKTGKVYYADLKIPNEEVSYLYEAEIITRWFKGNNIKHNLDKILTTLVYGDLQEFRKFFIEFCVSSLSYFDVTGNESEKFYHAFVLGMIVTLRDKYLIKSNRESGYGRYDIMMIPLKKNERGVIFEFKKVDDFEKETMETAIEAAKKQIIDRQYEVELRDAGINNIVRIAAVFDKKRVELSVF